MQLIKYTTIVLRLSGYGPAEVFINFTEELRHAETIPTCKIHESCCTSRKKIEAKIFRSECFAQVNPNAPKFEDRSQEETEWQEQGAHEAAWKLAKSVFKN